MYFHSPVLSMSLFLCVCVVGKRDCALLKGELWCVFPLSASLAESAQGVFMLAIAPLIVYKMGVLMCVCACVRACALV